MHITINDLIEKVSDYNIEAVDNVYKAYEMANELHKGQYRQSGEEYISHPLNVAYILADMHADSDTLCAGILHDTLEDTSITKDEIAEIFNDDVATLVDGVTKISKMNFSSKTEQNLANTRKIITGITDDVRIIIIKLADRLHNMRTLEYKSEFKQKENSVETLEIFAPLAYYIGAYRIKSELEDLAFKFSDGESYKKIAYEKMKIEDDSKACLNEMLSTIKKILCDRDIPNDIKVRTKNIYGIYKRMCAGNKITDIHDLLALKIMVEDVDSCYVALGRIHSEYKPINNMFKDYICNPKTNMYQSLHTTVFGENDRLVQTQIRTYDMDLIASFGLTAYLEINKGAAREKMQKDLKDKYQFFNSLIEINKVFGDNQEFVNQVKKEIFSNKVYVYTPSGEIMELPFGSTPIDFAYKVSSKLGNSMIGALVNDKYVDISYRLRNKDRVKIISGKVKEGPKTDWIDKVITTKAKRKIKELDKRK